MTFKSAQKITRHEQMVLTEYLSRHLEEMFGDVLQLPSKTIASICVQEVVNSNYNFTLSLLNAKNKLNHLAKKENVQRIPSNVYAFLVCSLPSMVNYIRGDTDEL